MKTYEVEIKGKKYVAVFKHYRVNVPENEWGLMMYDEMPTKGRPPESVLLPFSQKRGWVEIEKGEMTFIKVQPGDEPQPHGGKTECIFYASGDITCQTVATGVALCSMSDVFEYKVGRVKSFGRAVSALHDALKNP